MIEKKQREQEKVEDKELYVNVVRGPEKCRAEEIKGTLVKVAGRGGRVWPQSLQG